MKRLLVSMDDDRYEDLRRFAFEKKVPMAELVRHAIEKTFEDQLDGAAAQRGFEEYLRDPSIAVPWEKVMEELGIKLPGRNAPKSTAGAGKVTASRPAANRRRDRGAAARSSAKRRQETPGRRKLANSRG